MFPASNGNLRVPSPKAGSNNNSAYQENLSDYLENISRHPRTSSSTSRNAGNDNSSDKPLVHLVHPPKGPQIHSSEEPYTLLTIARPFCLNPFYFQCEGCAPLCLPSKRVAEKMLAALRWDIIPDQHREYKATAYYFYRIKNTNWISGM